MSYFKPAGLLAGFSAYQPDAEVPELHHVGEQWAPCNFFVPRHQHDVWEFYLQVSGESSWRCEDEIHTLGAAGFLAVPPHLSHQMHERPDAKHHFFFAAVDLSVALGRMPELAAYWQPESALYVPEAAALLAQFRHLVREVSLSLPHRARGLRCALDSLVLEASRLVLCKNDLSPNRSEHLFYHPGVLLAKELLDRSPGDPWRLTDLARRAGISPTHLAERFTKDVGMAPHQYLLHARVKQAQELLSATDISITQIAHELGFSSSQHFATVFKRITRRSASEYRRKGATKPSPTGRNG